MSDPKTQPTPAAPHQFLARHALPERAEDAATVMQIMARVTGKDPVMWGPGIIGYDSYDYTRKDGSEHTSLLTGVSPRKANLVIYVMPGFSEYGDLLARLGPHKTSRCCLYLTRLAKIDLSVLEELITRAVSDMRARYHQG